MVMGFTGWTRL